MTAALEAPARAAGFDSRTFELPDDLVAWAPPEARGINRDAVRLLVARRSNGAIEHRHFGDLPDVLDPGDVLVVNTSATLPASVAGTTRAGQLAAVHFSGRLPGGLWIVELRHAPVQTGAASSPWLDATPGTVIALPGGATVEMRLPASSALKRPGEVRLWVAGVDLPEPLLPYLARHGQPIRYSYVPDRWPISSYQTVFAQVPGSAEMASAARPFSPEVITRLVSRGVAIVPFVLHCGVASLENHEPPPAEWFRVPEPTAAAVNAARAAGHRVIAVGTTVVRALETVVDGPGLVHPGEGWTELVVDPGRVIRSADGLITGWHEPGASHLALLQAVAGPNLVASSYTQALEHGYLWHEFGDSHLVLP